MALPWIKFETLSARAIALPEADMPGNRFNDGKIDGLGRYWAGTMDLEQTAESGSLYRLDPDLSWERCDSDYIICNGPTFNIDSSVIYHTDSIKRTIYGAGHGRGGQPEQQARFRPIHGGMTKACPTA